MIFGKHKFAHVTLLFKHLHCLSIACKINILSWAAKLHMLWPWLQLQLYLLPFSASLSRTASWLFLWFLKQFKPVLLESSWSLSHHFTQATKSVTLLGRNTAYHHTLSFILPSTHHSRALSYKGVLSFSTSHSRMEEQGILSSAHFCIPTIKLCLTQSGHSGLGLLHVYWDIHLHSSQALKVSDWQLPDYLPLTKAASSIS